MKRIVITIIFSFPLASCTVQDIMNYLNGKENNLTKEQTEKVEQNKLNGKIDEQFLIEKDRGNTPPQH